MRISSASPARPTGGVMGRHHHQVRRTNERTAALSNAVGRRRRRPRALCTMHSSRPPISLPIPASVS